MRHPCSGAPLIGNAVIWQGDFMWSSKFSQCQNCNTVKIAHKARGYCKKCYPLVIRLEKVELWNYSDKDSLQLFPKGISSMVDEKYFNKMKLVAKKQLKERLDWLQIRERKLNEDIFGIDLEYGFGRLAKYCGVNKNGLFHSSANTFDHNFSMKQKKIIFKFIDDIEQNIKWRGIDWSEIIFLK